MPSRLRVVGHMKPEYRPVVQGPVLLRVTAPYQRPTESSPDEGLRYQRKPVHDRDKPTLVKAQYLHKI